MAQTMDDLDRTFLALGNGARRAIVARLAMGEAPISELAEPFDMSLTAVSKHVRVLADAGVVTVKKRGRTRYCRLEGDAMHAAADWLNDYKAFWEDRFDALAAYLEEDEGP